MVTRKEKLVLMLLSTVAALIVFFYVAESAAAAEIRPGDRLERDGRYIGSTGFFVERGGEIFMVISAHQALGWDGWVNGDCPAGQVYTVGGVEIGEFWAWCCYDEHGPGTDVAAVRIYPGVSVSNKIDGIQPLGFIHQERGQAVVGRGRGGDPVYGTGYGTPPNKSRANARLPGVQPGYSGSAIMSIDPPAITGVVHGGSGSMALAVNGWYALQVLGLEGARLVGGLPDNVIVIGSEMITFDEVFSDRMNTGKRINAAIERGYDYAVLHTGGIIVPIW